MKKYLCALICVLGLTLSCKDDKKAVDGGSQMEQVMAIHDEVMPKMSTLGKLVGELKTKVDTTEMGLKYEASMRDLQAAHTAMMDWMKGFGDRFNSDEILNGKELTEQKQKWLDEEEVKVKALKEQINSSIQNAQELLGKE
ncbi:hypothetical protein [Flagellimonas myxillae]|uniref:hypothetical protein n=1 Tax=Flagellimonas myxillae TaxID=2942214 RepID=UPI00201EAADA|nr:hypothetical protein [Muricauda myxillae]MCL6267504.1 hypothetical protein [Muricauda myxillae]